MKITLTNKEISTFEDHLIPATNDIVAIFTEEPVESINVREALQDKKTNGYEIINNTENENVEISINDEAVCDIIMVVTRLYVRFKPVINLFKSIVELIENIVGDYKNDIQELNTKWFSDEEKDTAEEE